MVHKLWLEYLLLSSIKVLAYIQVHCLVVLCTWYHSSSSRSSSISSVCQASRSKLAIFEVQINSHQLYVRVYLCIYELA